MCATIPSPFPSLKPCLVRASVWLLILGSEVTDSLQELVFLFHDLGSKSSGLVARAFTYSTSWALYNVSYRERNYGMVTSMAEWRRTAMEMSAWQRWKWTNEEDLGAQAGSHCFFTLPLRTTGTQCRLPGKCTCFAMLYTQFLGINRYLFMECCFPFLSYRH